MWGTGYALLDQLGHITGGIAVLRPQGSSATLLDLTSFVSGLQGPSSTLAVLVRLPQHTGAGKIPRLFCEVGGVNAKRIQVGWG